MRNLLFVYNNELHDFKTCATIMNVLQLHLQFNLL